MKIEDRIKVFKSHAVAFLEYGDAERLTIQLNNLGFFVAPASSKYHCNHEGGLFDHSLNVYDSLRELTRKNNLEWDRPESPFIIAFCHDLCKVDDYVQNKDGTYNYNNDSLFHGHADKSLILAHCLSIDLTWEEIACIRYHMGAFTDAKEWSNYTNAIHTYPNVLWTHVADMIATHITEVREEHAN